MPRFFVRRVNGPGHIIDADHVNELQVALEEDLDSIEALEAINTDGRLDALEAADAALAILRDPLLTQSLIDDFMSGSAGAGATGTQNWYWFNGALSVPDGEANHPGIVRKTTGAVINTYALIYLLLSAGGPVLPAATFDQTWVVRLNTNDANTTVRVGMGANCAANPPAAGIYFEKLAADTNWFRITRSGAVQTRTDHGVAVSTGWIKFRIRRINGTTLGFSINGGTEAQVTANIPTVGLTPHVAITNTAAADKNIDVDFFSHVVTGLVR
jgi:hypothetical protein